MAYWNQKFARTVIRDAKNRELLEAVGWRVFVAWECELKNLAALRERLSGFLEQATPAAHDKT